VKLIIREIKQSEPTNERRAVREYPNPAKTKFYITVTARYLPVRKSVKSPINTNCST